MVVAAERALKQPQYPAARVERSALLSVARAGKRLVTVGEHGVIAWSDDDGQIWQAAASNTDVTLTQVRFAGPLTGWAVGHLGVVLRTDDGGKTWQQQLDGNRVAKLALEQAQALEGAARTTALVAAQRAIEDGLAKPWLDLLVGEPGQVTVIGAFNMAVQTIDGGRQWRIISDILPNPGGYHLYGVAAAGDHVLVVGEHGLLLKGALRAESGVPQEAFQALPSPYEGSFFGVVAMTPDDYLAYGLRGNVFRTADGGRSWQRTQIAGASATFNGATVLGPGRVALCDQAGRVFLSLDGGRRFALLPSGGAPATGIVLSADGGLVASTLRGIVKILPLALKSVADKAP